MNPLFARRPAVLVESVGDVWAAFSPASGETILLNVESAAILEVLADRPCDTSAVCAALATDAGIDAGVSADVAADGAVGVDTDGG